MTQELLDDIETVVEDCDILNRILSAVNITQYITDLEQQLLTLKYNYDAQEIIIKDKIAIIDAMAQPKTCETCIYEFDISRLKCVSCMRVTTMSYSNYKPKDQQ